jgi:hypothetical protein
MAVYAMVVAFSSCYLLLAIPDSFLSSFPSDLIHVLMPLDRLPCGIVAIE